MKNQWRKLLLLHRCYRSSVQASTCHLCRFQVPSFHRSIRFSDTPFYGSQFLRFFSSELAVKPSKDSIFEKEVALLIDVFSTAELENEKIKLVLESNNVVLSELLVSQALEQLKSAPDVALRLVSWVSETDNGRTILNSKSLVPSETSVLRREVASGCCSEADKAYKIIRDNSKPEDNMESALDREHLQLTTPMVLDVLHMLQHEEKLAFRFFKWAGLVENYSHEPRVYNMMIDILSSTKYKIRQYRILCDILDYMKRNAKILVPVEVLMKILTQYCEKHLTSIEKFAKKKKIKVKKQPEVNALNLLLDALCKCSLVEEAETMFRRVKSKIKPNSDTYNTLFFGWCRVRDPSRGMSILEEMIGMGLAPDNFTYNTAIDTFCKSGMIKEALELLDFMKNKGSTLSSPTAKTYSIMIMALAKNDRMEECFKLIGDMMTSGCLPDVSTYKEVIESMCLAGKIDAAYKFLEDMGSKGYPPDILTYNCFLKVLCENKDRDNAERLYGKIIDSGCVPSAQSFNMLISMFFEMGDSDGAFDIWSEMDRWKCIRDVDTYCVMIEGLFRCNNPKDACFLLEEVVKMGMQLPYRRVESLLGHLSAVGDLHSIHKLSEHMRQFYNPAMARRFALNQKRKSMSLRGK